MAKQNCSNLVQLLKTRGFIDLVSVNRNGSNYFLADYGPPGTFLRRNALKQWWKLMVLQQSNVFPVESPVFQTTLDATADSSRCGLQERDTCFRENLQQDCISKYLQVLKLTNGRLPISVATVGPCLSWRDVKQDDTEEKVLLFGGCNVTRLLLQNYIPPTGTNTVFDYWLQLRLSWWKKFSRNPANFSVTTNKHSGTNNESLEEDTVTPEGSQLTGQSQYSMSITYQFPWGAETIEEVRYLGDAQLARLQKCSNQSYKGKTVANSTCLPHCIECSSSLEAATATWLVDSFYNRQPLSSAKSRTG